MAKILWRGTAKSIVLTWALLAIFTTVFGVIVISNTYASAGERLVGAQWFIPIGIMVLGLVVSMWSSRATVEVDDDEMRVKFGPGWPVRHFPWGIVATVEVVHVRPWDYGGWGYKVVLRKRTHAMVLRAGEGLRVSFVDGKVFVITIDGARQGLEIIRRILELK